MTMRSWIRNLFTPPAARPLRKTPARFHPALEVLEDRWVPATFTVNGIGDTGAGSGLTGDLRYCITQANLGGNNTIQFDLTVFNSPQTINLAGTQLELSDTTGTETITGPAAGVTVDGGGLSRVFQVDGLVAASISGMTITGGNSGYYAGGGLVNFGTLTLTNCTVSGNSANYGIGGGGLYNKGTATLTNCTVSGNSDVGINSNYGTATLTNTIVAGNGDGSLVDFAGDFSGTNNLIGGNPLLAPLGNYGGPTQTMPLLPGSPAIDAGTSGADIPTTDQRGLGRIGAIDIGAFESQGFTMTVVPGSTPQTANIGAAFANPPAVTVTANNPVEPVDGGVVSFVANRGGAATAVLTAPSAVIASGQAGVIAAPNNAVGTYTVVASATGASPTSFALTNAGPTFTSLVVNTTSDSLFPGTGLLSLREAIAFANLDSLGISSITFDPAVFANPQTINVVGGQLKLSNTSEAESITGPAAGVTVNGGGLSRVFQVDGLVTASISGLTITGGNAGSYYGNGGGVNNNGTLTMTNCTVSGNSAAPFGKGGGVNNNGTLTMTNCTVNGNSVHFYGGGGVNNAGTLTMTNCTVSGNSATTVGSQGGGVTNYGTATLTNCTISGNSGVRFGGGVSNVGTLTLTNCTVSGNHALFGGGVDNRGSLTLTNCTVSGNSAIVRGGGVENLGGTLTMTNCTVSGNSAVSGNPALGYGGGIFGGGFTMTNCTVSGNSASNRGGGISTNGSGATLTNCTISGNSAGTGGGLSKVVGTLNTLKVGNTIVAGNTATTSGPDAQGSVASLGHNLIGKTDGSSGWVDTDLTGTSAHPLNPLLAPLGNYGGPTQTMALLPGSPAIDAGTSGAGIPATDQRGLGRVGPVDIGAVERQAPTIMVPAAQTAFEDVDQSISGIRVGGDPQGQTPFTFTLTVGHGTLTLATTSGLTVTGNGSGLVSLSGSIAVINAALAGLVYRGTLNYSGPDTLNLTASDGNRSTQASVSITVKSAAAQAADLQTQVSALQSAGVLNQGQANSLIVKLNLKGNNGDIGKVQAFLNEVAADLKAGILTQAQAGALLGPGNILLLSVTRR